MDVVTALAAVPTLASLAWLASLVGGGPVLALGCGLGAGIGLFLIINGLRGRGSGDPEPGGAGTPSGPRWPVAIRFTRSATDGNGDDHRAGGVALAAVGAGIVAGVFTGWPVAALLTGLGVWALPRLLGGDPHARGHSAKVEAIASWTEMLRDTLGAAAGLEQAIAATAPIAPAPIRAQVQALQHRIDVGARLPSALRVFADDLNDATSDLVVCALVLASQHQSRHLGDLLAALAASAREQVTMRQRVETGRASTRTSVRIIVTVTVAMGAGLVLLNRAYLRPYDGAAGQLVLALIGIVFASALWWLTRIAQEKEPARVLTHLHALTDQPGATAPRSRG